MALKSSSILLASSLFALLAVNACAPPGGSYANPQVKGDHSTISGDKPATHDEKTEAY
jgi:hypothetical protein